MAKRISTICLCLIFLEIVTAIGQTKPEYSGVWLLDAAKSDLDPWGEVRVLNQTSDRVNLVILENDPRAHVLRVAPLLYKMDQWWPRRGGEGSAEKKVQARWDGDKLVVAGFPGSNGYVEVWSMSNDRSQLTVMTTEWKPGQEFTFREVEIPATVNRSTFIYSRVNQDSCVDCSFKIKGEAVSFLSNTEQGDLSFRVNGDRMLLTCGVTKCILREAPGFQYGLVATRPSEDLDQTITQGSKATIVFLSIVHSVLF